MGMLRRKDNEIPEQHVRPWLDKKGFPLKNYWNLLPYYKRLLHNQVCGCTSNPPPSDLELRNLYKKLCLPDVGGRESNDTVEFMPPEELRKFFTPIAPSETLSDFEKY